jgi:hypothetical protein
MTSNDKPIFAKVKLFSEKIPVLIDVLFFRSVYPTKTMYEAKVPPDAQTSFTEAAVRFHGLARPRMSALWKKWAKDNIEFLGANDEGAIACGQDEELA